MVVGWYLQGEQTQRQQEQQRRQHQQQQQQQQQLISASRPMDYSRWDNIAGSSGGECEEDDKGKKERLKEKEKMGTTNMMTPFIAIGGMMRMKSGSGCPRGRE